MASILRRGEVGNHTARLEAASPVPDRTTRCASRALARPALRALGRARRYVALDARYAAPWPEGEAT
jgi:hypothetical protein